MALVTLKAPFASKVLVASGIQSVSGAVKFVETITTKLPFATPFVPLKIRFPSETRTLLNTGCAGAATTPNTPIFNCEMSQARPGPGVAGVMFVNEPA